MGRVCRREFGGSAWVHEGIFALSALNAASNRAPDYSFGNINPNSLHLKVPHHLDASCNDLWDASLEETFHLLADGGAAEAYPEDWEDKMSDRSEWATSTAAKFVKTMYNAGDYDTFGGGRGNDPDPGTIVGEGVHFAMLTTLGAFNFTDTGSPLTSEQWFMPLPDAFKAKYPAFYELLTDRDRFPWIPRVLPDGNYKYGFAQQSLCAPEGEVSDICNVTWPAAGVDASCSVMAFGGVRFFGFATLFAARWVW